MLSKLCLQVRNHELLHLENNLRSGHHEQDNCLPLPAHCGAYCGAINSEQATLQARLTKTTNQLRNPASAHVVYSFVYSGLAQARSRGKSLAARRCGGGCFV